MTHVGSVHAATVAVVTDTTHYLPRELVRGARHPRGQSSTSTGGDAPRARVGHARLRRLLRAAAHARPSCRRPRSRRSATSSRSTSRCSPRATTSSRSTSPAGSRGPSSRARQAAAELAAPGGGASRSSTRGRACGGLGLVVLAAQAAAARGGDVDAVAARAPRRARRLKIWFAVDTLEYLRRGGRIGTRAGLARRRAEDQADPDARATRSRRSSACAPPAARSSAWSTTCAPATTTAPTAWVVQHIQAPDDAERLVERGREIFGTEPVFVSEVGPVIGAHVGPGCSGVGAPAADDLLQLTGRR